MKTMVHSGRVALLLLPLLLGFGVLLLAPAPVAAQNDWRIGNIVYLTKGTQIWTAPTFGNGSCYHTVVPVDDWAVKVINGPRTADGRTWYDTSRQAAGDPSGGTGWVNIEQVDQHPNVLDSGRYCPPGGSSGPISGGPTTSPGGTTTDDKKGGIWEFITSLFTWWRGQVLAVKIGVVVVALFLLPLSMRLRALGSPLVVGLARAILWGVVLGGLADLTRPIWEVNWLALPPNYRPFDPAIALLFLPLGWWAFGFIAAIAGVGIALGALALGLLLMVVFFAYLLAWFQQF